MTVEEKPCDHCDFQERDERESNIARQAAAQAREDVLNEIIEHLDTTWTMGMIRAYIESLHTKGAS